MRKTETQTNQWKAWVILHYICTDKRKRITNSQGGEEYPTRNKQKEGELDWSQPGFLNTVRKERYK